MAYVETVPLLKRFGIKVPEDFNEYNLIGLDYGDGELSAAYVGWDKIKERINILGLALAPNAIFYKNPNAFYISPTMQSIVYDAQVSSLDEKDDGIRYYNFKKCPGTSEADSKYIRDDGTTSDLTYKEVMAKGFNRLVNILFESNRYVLDRNKPTIILVGRPSSPGWVHSELEYAKLLQDGLELPENQKSVYVAIQSESTAALAREIDPKWDHQRVKKGEIVVVLDNGSSTFDITVITRNGVEGEDSYQFGGNQLDENLLKLMQKELIENCSGVRLKTIHGHKLGLRIKKENYYGINGGNHDIQPYNVELKGTSGSNGRPPKYTFTLSDDVMDEAIGEMPVRAFHYKRNMDGSVVMEPPINCPSWIAGCKIIYQRFYDGMKELFAKKTDDPNHPVVPDRIILSGGVSVMRKVQKTVEEVFGVRAELADSPNYSVSEGLAYVLGTEIKKGQLLKELMEQLDRELPNEDALRESIGDAGEDEVWTWFAESMKKWSEEPGYLSIMEWYNDYYEKYFDHSLNRHIQKGAERWYEDNKLEERITQMLKSHFEKMFPDYIEQFTFNLPTIEFSALEGVVVTIWTNWKFFFSHMERLTEKAALDKPRDQAWRKEAYNYFLTLKNKVKKGGDESYTYQVQVEKGLIFKHMEVVNRTYTEHYAGIRSSYNDSITPAVAKRTREDIIKLLKAPLEEYVESITPYFNMTARKSAGGAEND